MEDNRKDLSEEIFKLEQAQSEKEKTAFEQMSEDLRSIREALERLEKSGISRELMVIYIQKKTRLGAGTVKAVLEAQKTFLKEAFR